MIKVYLQKTFPKSERPDNYRGLTSLSTNIGPGELDKILMAMVPDIVEFYMDTHPEKTVGEINRMVTKALALISTNLVISRAVE
ncbi:MAG: hypothetical protein ACYSW3_02005 [Planctomycetota bacterium]|jgi:hypothetical protein